MIEHVFRPTRKRNGKAVQSRLFSGRYSLGKGHRPVTVALHVTDRKAAVAKLRALVVEKEREAAGLLAPASEREASALPVVQLVEAYRSALVALGRDDQHVQGTCNRLLRMASEIGWGRLSDVRPDMFTVWLAGLKRAAKTRKEYQVSANAWLNWLVKTERLPRNPLARLDHVETRGKKVREARSLSAAEIERWLAVSGPRRLVYLVLLYTGARKGELRELRWSDLTLAGDRPQMLLRDSTTKAKAKRAIPLHPVLVAELIDEMDTQATVHFGNGAQFPEDGLVFETLPRWATLQKDFRKAGIPHKDATGRVVHFHALRKTFQTLGVVAGVNQRSAQALLGHSDPSLTANVYTDHASLELHREVAKLPVFGATASKSGAVDDAQKCELSAIPPRFRALLGELISLAQVVVSQEKTAPCEGGKMVDATGLEPVIRSGCYVGRYFIGICVLEYVFDIAECSYFCSYMASVWKHPKSKYWSACYNLPDGRRTKRTTKLTDRKKAQVLADQWEAMATTMVTVTNARKVISDIYKMNSGNELHHFTARSFLETWVSSKRPEVSLASAEKYDATSVEFLNFLGERADQDLLLLTLEDLHAFRDHVAQRSSPKTANNKLVIVAQAFRTAWKDGHLAEDIASRVRKVKLRGKQQKRDPFTYAQVCTLLAHAKDEWEGMIYFGFYTGQRLGDIATLSWDCIDLRTGVLVFVAEKSKRDARIPLAPPLLRWVKKWKTKNGSHGSLFPKSDALVRSNKGKVAALSKQFLLIMAACGLAERREQKPKGVGRDGRRTISRLSFHSFRHTLTSELKNVGGGAAITQDIVGHESTAVSKQYTHVNDEDKRRYLKKLPDIAKSRQKGR